MSSLIPVRLLANYRIYNGGEVVGFPPDEAADLIQRNLAEPYESTAGAIEEGEADAPKPRAKK